MVLGRFDWLAWFCRWFWAVLLVVLGGFRSFWLVLAGFGWFRVLVTTVRNLPLISVQFVKYSSLGLILSLSRFT